MLAIFPRYFKGERVLGYVFLHILKLYLHIFKPILLYFYIFFDNFYVNDPSPY